MNFMEAAKLAKEGTKITYPNFPDNSYITWDAIAKKYQIWLWNSDGFTMNPDFMDNEEWVTESGHKLYGFSDVLLHFCRGGGIRDKESDKIIMMDSGSNVFYKCGHGLFAGWADITPRMLISNEWSIYVDKSSVQKLDDGSFTE